MKVIQIKTSQTNGASSISKVYAAYFTLQDGSMMTPCHQNYQDQIVTMIKAPATTSTTALRRNMVAATTPTLQYLGTVERRELTTNAINYHTSDSTSKNVTFQEQS